MYPPATGISPSVNALSNVNAKSAFVAPSVRPGTIKPASTLQGLKTAPSPAALRTPVVNSLRSPQSVRQNVALKMSFEDMFNFENPFEPKTKKPPVEKTTFNDVAGVKEAKQELQEVIDFLKDPAQFSDIGATIPKGVLLSGPPGTGKTLLAKAVAGEAGVPFYSASGSQFVEMYVGRGAARVRDLFKEAKRNAPSIIFIDEIDAVGKKRSDGGPNSNDEREQTLNQLLTEMNGFEDSDVIVLGATNRPDMLDDALLRPGRFDRKVSVGLPDRGGREEILAVHARKVNMADDVDLKQIAKRTPGFAGADLKNLINEAAILAIRNKRTSVTNADLSAAIDRVIAGPEKVGTYISEERKRLVAYHEAGHAIVGHRSPEFDNIEKITIVPRGNAGGLTWFTPNEKVLDSGLATVKYLKSQIAVALGGRIAEELAFGKDSVTTGASNDLQKVTQIARQMVERYGMSNLGPLSLESQSNAFMRGHSEELAKEIDIEVRALVKEAYDDALAILTENIDKLDGLAEALVQKETMEGQEFRDLMDPPSAEELARRDAEAKLADIKEQAAADGIDLDTDASTTGESKAKLETPEDSGTKPAKGDEAMKRWSDMEINPYGQAQPDRKLGFKRD